MTKLSRLWPFGVAIFAVDNGGFFLALMRHDKAGVAVELLKLRQVTYTSA